MKINYSMLLAVLVSAITAAFVLTTPGCTTLNPVTGQREYDPGKTENVKAAIEPFVGAAVYDVIRNSPEHSDSIAQYFRSIGGVFRRMETEAAFDPAYLIQEIDLATKPWTGSLPTLAVAGKNAALNIYQIAFNWRLRAELSPEKWPVHVADLLADAIDQALKDAGKAGL